MKETILKQLQKIVKDLTPEDIKIDLSIPNDNTHGDYATNVSFQLSKLLGKNPLQVAQELVAILEKHKEELGLEKVEAVAPGFINFHLSQASLGSNLQEMLDTPEKIGTTTKMENRKVSVEFTDPNPFKEFHIGHLYTNTVGESLSSLLEANGAEVHRADYFGDVGMHVAKALWGLQKKMDEDNISMDDLSKKPLEERIEYFGKAYAKGATAYEQDSAAQEDMKLLNRLAYISAQRMWEKEKGLKPEVNYQKDSTVDQKELERVYSLYVQGRKWSLEYFETIYKRLGMKFAGYYPESIAGERGYKLVKEHIADGTFVEDQGAVIFPGEKHGLHTRVFINSLGLPTYEAKELGLAPWKYENFQYDFSIILTGNEINEYFKVLIEALSKISPDLAKKTKHIGHGMVKLTGGRKMSSRTGQVITADDVLKEATDLAKQKITEAKLSSDSSREEIESISESVGVGAVKYAFLKSSIGKDIAFSFEESVSFDGNSGPYVQYTYTRTQSVLHKAGDTTKYEVQSSTYSPQSEESQVLRKLTHFPEIVESAATTYSPNVVTEYLFELSQLFNNFYQKYRIVNASSEDEKNFRLALTAGVGIVLKKGLSLLGIEAPEKM